MTKKKILFIVNNLSGTVREKNITEIIHAELDMDQFEPSFFTIDQDIKKSEYKKTLKNQWDVIVTVGGDGTLMRLGKRIVNREVILGIIPIGSGNGMATHIGYKPRDIHGAIRAINAMKTKRLDLAQFGDNKYFFSNLGYGLDALVAKEYKKKKNRSFWVYTYLTLKALFSLKALEVTYEVDGERTTVKSYLFNVFNSNYYGYGVGLLPWPTADDGLLDIGYIEAVPFWKLPWISICVLVKKPNWSKHIKYFNTTNITIINEGKIYFQVDGDPKKQKGNIDINVLPKKLNFIVP